MPTPEQLLRRHWGHASFRPLQREIIDSVLQGHDTVALLPTGGGKSLCYQIPALMADGLCLVVSPLIALMKDQVQQLNERHLKAACLVAGMSAQEVSTVLNNCLYGKVKFLYVSPERLRQRMFIEHYRHMKVNLIAVDEAHCVSQWGYDFRPPYLQIADIRPYHPGIPLIALTATATPAVVDDIVVQLRMRAPQRFRSSFFRPNLTYRVVYDEDRTSRLLRLIGQTPGSGIVYTRSRRGAQHLSELLNANGIAASYYHAGLDVRERDQRQALWMQGKCRIMVATNAFGMGIDKPDVRLVAHVDIPNSLESYFQEAGRAGRDGQPATCVIFASNAGLEALHATFRNEFPPLPFIRNTYRALCNLCQLPIGSGADTSFDFDLEGLCQRYHLDPVPCYNACRILEREGLIGLPDRDSSTSLLHIAVGREELYRFQVDHLRLGNLLLELVRMYPGLFTLPVPIDERRIASRCNMAVGEVKKDLVSLHEMRLVEYRPARTQPQVVFTSPRIDERDIFLGGQQYAALQAAAQQRMQAMEAYLLDHDTCRSHRLLAYFGEPQPSEDCGVCDVCQTRQAPPKSDAPALERRIIHLLCGSRLSVRRLCELLETEDYRIVEETVARLVDSGALYLDRDMLLNVS